MSRRSCLFVPSHPFSPHRLTQRAKICERRSNRIRVVAALPALDLSPTQQNILTAISLPCVPIVTYSEYVLFSNGCGLPPGPYGLLGAAEGISYLVVAGMFLLSIYSKISTGKGLPEGPSKLLGAVEGLVFLLVVAGLGIAGYTHVKYGSLPEAAPSPGSRCYPVE